ncbi:DUF4157 domain-containing protein [Acaryochloris sp. CCMEE 5410]|nr:DUF4157 domain-containing protein [Acaryochloris sp. CCMEE 5410]
MDKVPDPSKELAQPWIQRKQGLGQLSGQYTPTPQQGMLQPMDATQLQPDNFHRENHTGMPDPLKSGLEQLSGFDLSNVRVHRSSAKPAQLNALAYAQGQDIHLGPGEEQHLPHEGWHVVQQMQGRVKPTLQAQGVSINEDDALEHEADVMGAKALAMKGCDQITTRSLSTTVGGLQRKENTIFPFLASDQLFKAGFSSNVIQCDRDTLAVVLPTVAKKIYKNALKGDPPFKPQKGNYGRVSWFKGEGNPWIGGATGGGNASNTNVVVNVTIEGAVPRKPNDYFERTISELEQQYELSRARNEHQGVLWRLLGQSLEADPVAEVPIPYDKYLNSKEDGTFITVGASGRDKIRLPADGVERLRVAIREDDKNAPDELAQEVEEKGKQKAEFIIKVLGEDTNRYFQVQQLHKELDRVANEIWCGLGLGDRAGVFGDWSEGIVRVSGPAGRVRRLRKDLWRIAKDARISPEEFVVNDKGLSNNQKRSYTDAYEPTEDLSDRIKGSVLRSQIADFMKELVTGEKTLDKADFLDPPVQTKIKNHLEAFENNKKETRWEWKETKSGKQASCYWRGEILEIQALAENKEVSKKDRGRYPLWKVEQNYGDVLPSL